MATTPTTIKAGTPRDFLGLVPALLGFTPHASLVLVPFEATRTIGAMRFDLDTDAATLAHTGLGLICRVPRATGVAAVIYATEDAASTRDLGQQIIDVADHQGLHLVDVLYVASDGYGSHLTDEAPAPLTEIATPDALRDSLAASQSAGASIPDADPARAARIAFAAARLDDDALADFVTVAEDALTGDPADLDTRLAALLLTGIGIPLWRDVALIQWATDRDTGTRAMAAQIGYSIMGAAIPEDIARILIGQGDRPDAERLTAGLALVRHLAAYADDQQRPNLLAAAAWLSWALGRSTHAAVYTDRALAIDPDHGMSQIVATLCSAAVLPDWAFSR